MCGDCKGATTAYVLAYTALYNSIDICGRTARYAARKWLSAFNTSWQQAHDNVLTELNVTSSTSRWLHSRDFTNEQQSTVCSQSTYDGDLVRTISGAIYRDFKVEPPRPSWHRFIQSIP
jgi:hypothetical protein